jgi:hypothetical protein
MLHRREVFGGRGERKIEKFHALEFGWRLVVIWGLLCFLGRERHPQSLFWRCIFGK